MKNDWGPLGGWRMLPDGSYRRVYADNAAARKSGKTRAFDRARRATVSFWDGAWHYEVMELELPGQAVRKVVARGSECFVVAFAAFGPADEAAPRTTARITARTKRPRAPRRPESARRP